MAKVYMTRCIVKKNDKAYKRGTIIEGLTDAEIKQGLAQHWLEKVGNDDDEPIQTGRTSEQKKRDKLLAKAKEAGITVTDAMPDEEIEKKLGEAYKRKNLLTKAAKLGITVKEEMTNEEIQKLITDAKAK